MVNTSKTTASVERLHFLIWSQWYVWCWQASVCHWVVSTPGLEPRHYPELAGGSRKVRVWSRKLTIWGGMMDLMLACCTVELVTASGGEGRGERVEKGEERGWRRERREGGEGRGWRRERREGGEGRGEGVEKGEEEKLHQKMELKQSNTFHLRQIGCQQIWK